MKLQSTNIAPRRTVVIESPTPARDKYSVYVLTGGDDDLFAFGEQKFDPYDNERAEKYASTLQRVFGAQQIERIAA